MKELLFSVTKKDFDVQTFCAGGAGGQHQNKTSSAVRIVHRDSGAVGESREEREQSRNKKIAFQRLTSSDKFKMWLRVKASEMMMEETVEEKLDRLMQNNLIKTETKNEKGQWVQTELPFLKGD
jgi:protein subunit release factor B